MFVVVSIHIAWHGTGNANPIVSSYERHAILEWFEACRRDSREPTSPMTGQSMTSEDVMSNHALKSRIQVNR